MEPGGTAPPLRQHVSTWEDAKRWLTEKRGFRYYNDIKGLGHLTAEEQIEFVNTLIDLEPTHVLHRLKKINIIPDAGSSYHQGTWEMILDPNDGSGINTERTISFIDRQLELLTETSYAQMSYVKDLKEWKRQLMEGEAEKAHTIYWFGEERRIEAVVRHEAGHAFHEQYMNGNIYGDPGVDSLIQLSKDWRKDFGITSRGIDNWTECVAENYVAWTIGRTDLMSPKMVSVFERLIRTKG